MKPGRLAKDQCCNWIHGACLGAGFTVLPDGEIRHCLLTDEDGETLEGQPCRVARGERCEFFERVVLPVAESPGEIAARTAYMGEFPVDGFAGKARYCSCGEPIPRRRRMCDSCRSKRRRETYRRNRKNARGPRNS